MELIHYLIFQAEAKIKAEAELVNLRKEVLLLGEMQRRYREKISLPRPEEQEQVKQLKTYLGNLGKHRKIIVRYKLEPCLHINYRFFYI